MGEIIVVTSGKGGVGKSTVTANLGVNLARAGCTCALIDMDMGLRSLDVMLGLQDKVVYDLADVAQGMCRVKQALVKHPDVAGLSLLAAAQMRGSDALSQRQAEKTIGLLRDRFDYILIDSPAGVGRGFQNATAYADRALLVETPDAVAMRDAQRVLGLLEQHNIRQPALIVNRVRPARRGDDCAMTPDALKQLLGIEVIGMVPEDDAVCMRAIQGRPAFLNDTAAGAALKRIARRLRGEDVALETIKRPGLVQRLWAAIRPYEVY